MKRFNASVGQLPDPQIFKTPPYFKGSMSMIYGHGEVLPYPEIGRNLKPGDVLELQLDHVGVLKTIVPGPEVAPWWPQERPYPWKEGE